MKEMGKRILALAMALCLTLALGTTALAAEVQTVTATATPDQAGQEINSITLTATEGDFAELPSEGNFTIQDNADIGVTGVNVSSATTQPDNKKVVTLGVSPFTANKSGDLTITIQKDAFAEADQPTGGSITATLHIQPAATPEITVSDKLQAGVAANTITISTTGNTFAATSSADPNYSINTNGKNTDVTLQSVTATGTNQATLQLSGTPTEKGSISVTVLAAGFTNQPGASVTGTITVDPAATPSVTASANGELKAGTEGTIKLTIGEGKTFSSSVAKEDFTLTGGVNGKPTSITTGNSDTIDLTVTPDTASNIEIQIAEKAFTYQPGAPVKATGTVSVSPADKPEVSATGSLTAGAAGGSITLRIDGGTNTFAESLEGTWFTLTTDNGDDLTVSGATPGGSNETTLTVSGTPTKKGNVTKVAIAPQAFKYQPGSAVDTKSSSVTIGAATVTMDQPTPIVAGNDNKIELNLTAGTFADNLQNADFTVSGDGASLASVHRDNDQKATLTLTAAPTSRGSISVTALVTAFKYQPDNQIVTTVEVQAPSGPVNAALSGSPGTLTAGVEAGGTTIQLTSSGSVNFTNDPSKDYFTLEKGTGELGTLAVSGATGSGKTVTLSLTGIPQKQGTFKVKIGQGAFVASPGQDLTATDELTINYPTVTVSPSPDHLVEDDDTVKTIELTATGSVFKNINQSGETGDFTFADYTDIKLASVTATEGSSVATLTFTGTPENSGELTINVQPTAFKYQPAGAVSTTVSITLPSGTLKAALNNGPLSAGTPVTTQTITLTINDSKGLHFKDKESGLQAGSFTLVDTTSDGLEIADVTYVSPTQVTLTLKGTPTAAGTFKVQAATDAFKAAPEAEQTTENQLPVQDAPSGSVTAAPSGLLYAGTPADGTTVTLTATGLTFAAAADKSSFTLEGDAAEGLEITDVKLSDGKIILTLSGTPAKAGTFQVQVAQKAFTVYPAADVNSDNITVGAANIKLALSDNGLQAGKENMTFKVTPSGGKLIDLANRAAAIDTGADLDGLTLGDMTQNADGSVTVAIMGMPPVAGSITITFQASMFSPAPEGPVSLTVPVAEGEQAAEPETKPGAPGIGFTAPMDELAASVLTPEEQALYEKGAQVLIELVESPDAQVPEADKTVVTAAAGEYTVGEYLDVSLIKTINGVSDTVSETNKAIRVVFTIPTDLQAAGRQFAVIRVHDGKAEFLKTVSSTASTITVESDRFSTYAIVYREAPATATPAPTQTSTATPAPTDSVPDTGDDTALPGWTALLLGCAAALTAAVLTLRRKDRRG